MQFGKNNIGGNNYGGIHETNQKADYKLIVISFIVIILMFAAWHFGLLSTEQIEKLFNLLLNKFIS